MKWKKRDVEAGPQENCNADCWRWRSPYPLQVQLQATKNKFIESLLHSHQHLFRGLVEDKTNEVAEAAQGKVEDVKETGALYKTQMVEELKKNPSTILEEAGEKLEVAKEAMGEKVEEMEEKAVPAKDDDSD